MIKEKNIELNERFIWRIIYVFRGIRRMGNMKEGLRDMEDRMRKFKYIFN